MNDTSDKLIVDLNDIFPVKASVQDVRAKVSAWDVSSYKDKPVQIRGCSPTWAHLMVMGKLVGTAASIEFLLDDAKGGIPIPVYHR